MNKRDTNTLRNVAKKSGERRKKHFAKRGIRFRIALGGGLGAFERETVAGEMGRGNGSSSSNRYTSPSLVSFSLSLSRLLRFSELSVFGPRPSRRGPWNVERQGRKGNCADTRYVLQCTFIAWFFVVLFFAASFRASTTTSRGTMKY